MLYMIRRLLGITAFLLLLPFMFVEMFVRVMLLFPLYIVYGNLDIADNLFTAEWYFKIENKLGL